MFFSLLTFSRRRRQNHFADIENQQQAYFHNSQMLQDFLALGTHELTANGTLQRRRDGAGARGVRSRPIHPTLSVAEIDEMAPAVPFSQVLKQHNLASKKSIVVVASATMASPSQDNERDAASKQVESLDVRSVSSLALPPDTKPPTEETDIGLKTLQSLHEDADNDKHNPDSRIMCTICQCTIGVDDYDYQQDRAPENILVRVLPCTHCYHDECITSWLSAVNAVCPTCMHCYKEEDSKNTETSGSAEATQRARQDEQLSPSPLPTPAQPPSLVIQVAQTAPGS